MQNPSNSKPKPLISFIVPAYNIPDTMLRECIGSILALSLRPFEREIIVVDDGSATPAIGSLGNHADDVVYIRQANAGLSAARNRGLLMAQGDYVQFVDADDMLIQAPYEHCLDLARYCHPDMVMFDFATDLKPQTVFNDRQPMSGSEHLRSHNLHATAWGYIFRRSILGELRFTDGIYHEDEEFTPLLLLRADKVCTTDARAYFYRTRPDSITTNTSRRSMLKRLNDTHAVIARLDTVADTLTVDDRTALRRRVAQLTMDYIYNIIVETRSRHYLDRKLRQLEREGLFPLPDRDYTSKYKWFRRMTNSQTGITILFHTLPRLHKER